MTNIFFENVEPTFSYVFPIFSKKDPTFKKFADIAPCSPPLATVQGRGAMAAPIGHGGRQEHGAAAGGEEKRGGNGSRG